MFWADKIAEDIIKSGKYKPYWVDDMKTPSGKIHVGSLRAVTTHDIVYKSLTDRGAKATFSYVFDNHDPMDGLPTYLPKEVYEQYLGMPLFMIPSPGEEAKNFAEYYALEFQRGFNQIGCFPKIIWATDLYYSGKMNDGIRKCLDHAGKIRSFYEQQYKKTMPSDWYPFNVYCPSCKKVSTTKVTNWNGEQVTFICKVDAVKWTNGCGYEGKISPFATKDKINGKLPWKVEWAVKWQAIGITIEGAGKDHMTKGGSHDLAEQVAEKVLEYPTPYAFAHEFFLVGGKKMSSSKGTGVSVTELLAILPAQLVRFLIAKTKLNQAINFDPSEKDTIPTLFDEYQKAASAYFEKGDRDLARIFELSQVNGIQKPPAVRFSVLAQWVQMPNMQREIKKQGANEWATYARIWLEKYAPEAEKFFVQEQLPDSVKHLSEKQKTYLQKIASEIEKERTADDLQKEMYEWAKELALPPKESFAAIYQALLGKDHGPKAAWLILSLEKGFVIKRFTDLQNYSSSARSESRSSRERDASSRQARTIQSSVSHSIFSIAPEIKRQFPSISIGIATIKEVAIQEKNEGLEEEKTKFLESQSELTTEQLGKYAEIQSYRKLYKDMGVDWHSRRPSPEALLRRVALKKGLYTINTCVDAYNLVVMRNRVSVGAFDLDTIKFPTLLRFAHAGEEIMLLGDEVPTRYKETEVAYFDEQGGFNIDFNYRDAKRTAVQLSTKNLYINVDGIYAISIQQVEQALQDACDEIIKYCGGVVDLFGVVKAS